MAVRQAGVLAVNKLPHGAVAQAGAGFTGT
jgi:hypothetical protein